MNVIVRNIAATDLAAWAAAYRGYRDFYKVAHDPAAFDTVWAWLQDPNQEVRGLVAELDGEIVGLAHFRRFARPLSASTGIFLDDLFTVESARSHGVGSALLPHLGEIARDEGATVVRWITAADNETARRLYDRVSTQTPWVTYDLAPASA